VHSVELTLSWTCLSMGDLMTYRFPQFVRPASLQERKTFYEKEFKLFDAVRWLEKFYPYRMSITFDLGVESGIIKDNTWKDNAFIKLGPVDYNQLKEVLLKFLPEDAYYDRYLYYNASKCYDCEKRIKKGCFDCEGADGQQLVFDVDPENYWCPQCDTEGSERHHSFCETCFKATKEATLYLYDVLSESYSDLQIVSTGRGFHIHVFDRDSFHLSVPERELLVSKVKEVNIAVDSYITIGKMYLIRLPYTLNGLVSRVAVPLSVTEVEKLAMYNSPSIPQFIKEADSGAD
jgi:DNA primase catalytic subunit